MLSNTWIQTYTGIKFDLLNPRVEDVNIDDIAHALSLSCRFGGHCKSFYSVAEHSVRVSRHLRGRNRIYGLLHDAAEAYIGDMVRPLKHSGQTGDFADVENRILLAVFEFSRIELPLPEAVKCCDNIMLSTEARDLMGNPPEPWPNLPEPFDEEIFPWDSRTAEEMFLQTFDDIQTRIDE